MNRRRFLQTLVALGASIALPLDLSARLADQSLPPSEDVIDRAWTIASRQWGLFEVDDYGTLSYANFEEPRTRREIYNANTVADFNVQRIEAHWSLCVLIQDCFRESIEGCAGFNQSLMSGMAQDIDDRVESDWPQWFEQAIGPDRFAIDTQINAWLDDAPDWDAEGEAIYRNATAQGAAYHYFCSQPREDLEALGIRVIEGDCPGSSYFAAELQLSPEKANAIAIDQDWAIRFVREGRALEAEQASALDSHWEAS
jgi:hypothetical protein